jgi:hypothetical protein
MQCGDFGESYYRCIVQLFCQNRKIVGGCKSFQVGQYVQNPVTSHSRLAFLGLTKD